MSRYRVPQIRVVESYSYVTMWVCLCVSAVCILVSAEVLANSVKYEREHLPARVPYRAEISFGFSFGLAWMSFCTFVVATIVFAILSRKKKGYKARNENEAIENEPVHIGRP